jgi:hypothetical protein
MVTIRVRSMVWFATGVVLALFVPLMVMQAWRVDAAPGDSDTTFVSMTSCRLTDTRVGKDRVGPNASWGAKDTKTLQATGTNGNCTVPAEAVGLSMKVFALNATTESFLTFWDTGTLPLGSALNPSPGGILFSAVTTDLSAVGSFNVYNEAGTVDVIIDVNGYYTKKSLQELAQRLAAVEAAQAAGVDPAVLARISALESSTATNTAGVAGLETAQPFAVSASTTDFTALTTTPTSYLNLQVTINYSTYISNSTDGAESICNVYTGAPPNSLSFNEPGVGFWETGGLSDAGSVSGTKQFDIAAGTTTYSLVCEEYSGNGAVYGRAMTAIFTPAP